MPTPVVRDCPKALRGQREHLEFMPEEARRAITSTLAAKPNVQVFTYSGCHHAFSCHNGEHYDAAAAAQANRRTWSFLSAMLRDEGAV